THEPAGQVVGSAVEKGRPVSTQQYRDRPFARTVVAGLMLLAALAACGTDSPPGEVADPQPTGLGTTPITGTPPSSPASTDSPTGPLGAPTQPRPTSTSRPPTTTSSPSPSPSPSSIPTAQTINATPVRIEYLKARSPAGMESQTVIQLRDNRTNACASTDWKF